MSNLILAFPNRIDEATLSGGSWQSTLPRANLQDRVLGHVARTADAALANTQFDVDLGKSRRIRMLAIVRHNLSVSAKVRLRGNDTASFTAPAYDSGWVDAWPRQYATAEMAWEDPNFWSGRPSQEQRDFLPKVFIHVADTMKFLRYWRVEVDDTTNPDGYVEAGRVFIGEVWQPTYNASYGWKLGVDADTRIDKAVSGTEYFDRRSPARTQTFSLDWLTADEAFQRAFDLHWRQGLDREVFFIADPADSVNLLRRSWLARLEQINPIEQPYFAHHRAAFAMKEIL